LYKGMFLKVSSDFGALFSDHNFFFHISTSSSCNGCYSLKLDPHLMTPNPGLNPWFGVLRFGLCSLSAVGSVTAIGAKHKKALLYFALHRNVLILFILFIT
jgi:hypothetical protein